ncbi:PD-(D/E)XK nuclease family protein [Sinomonas sp. P10A9]|uniref:PD-(D/E)XK nuclease family protein n=1 Tax=Sinomonas puerhi TaxID=3238584 RepID=A0AB39L619_9MICC
MIVEFGWFLDRAPWAYASPGLNRVRVGRKNLIGLLQTRLGLTRAETPNAERVSQYLATLEHLDSPDAWFHDSLHADAWSTAYDLLAARDDAVANGWRGDLPDESAREDTHARAGTERGTAHDGGPSPLLRTLAAAERAGRGPERAGVAGGGLAPSLADDVAELLDELESSPLPLGIDELVLQHPEETFPAVWRRIIGALRDRGVRVSEAPQSPGAPELTVLSAETEWEAAEHAARWLAAGGDGGGDSGANASTAVVCSDPTPVLDQYLTMHGQPRLGVGEQSVWRAQDALIPLFFELVWEPANVHLLAEFLTLPDSPVKRRAARHLLRSLAREPGTRGPEWERAIADIGADETLGPDLAAQLDRTFSTHLLLDVEHRRPTGGQLVEATSWFAAALNARAAVVPRLQPTSAQLKRVLALVAPLRHVSRKDLRRIVASVVTADAEPILPAEAAPWLRLNHLVELGEDVEDVLWWGFQSASTPRVRRWDAHDAATLARVGVELPSPQDLTALAVRETLAAAGRCRRLVVVQIAQRNGERVDSNPLLEALVERYGRAPAVGGASPGVGGGSSSVAERIAKATRVPSDLTDADGVWRLAGRTAQLRRAEAARPSAPDPVQEVGANTALAPETLSYSQLDVLLGCSMRWALERKGSLRVPDAADIPEGSRMIGSFAHRVIEKLHAMLRPQHRAVPTDTEIRAVIDTLVPQLASELLLPGQKARRLTVEAAVREAASTFFAMLEKGGIVLQEVEQEFSKDLPLVTSDGVVAVPVRGAADAVGIDSDGRTVVIDLKWYNSVKYLREKVRKGTALQLALYQWALHEGDAPPDDPTAYYLLKQHAFASAHGHFGPAIPREETPAQLWGRAVRSAEFTIEQVLGGRVTATKPVEDAFAEQAKASTAPGEQPKTIEDVETAVGRLYVQPGCRFCHFGALCGLKGDYS